MAFAEAFVSIAQASDGLSDRARLSQWHCAGGSVGIFMRQVAVKLYPQGHSKIDVDQRLTLSWMVVALSVCGFCTRQKRRPSGLRTCVATSVSGIRGRLSRPAVGSAIADIGDGRAVLFDCDGVIVETEELHRIAYNQVFAEFETGVTWSEDYYIVLMNKIGGGKPKMCYHFGQNGWPASTVGPPPDTEEAQTALIDILQARKTEIFEENIAAGKAEARPGIIELIDEALDRPDLKTAVCSAATKSAVVKVLGTILGADRVAKFDLLLMGDDVKKKKPDPMIYKLAAERLCILPSNCAVIEDSKIGLEAALGAGMPCFITYTASTSEQDFEGAELVVADATRLSLAEILPAQSK